MSEAKAMKRALLKKKKKKRPFKERDLLSSGSTLLNLNCSGFSSGAFLKGLYIFLVGDTSSGKTFLTRTCLAEAAINTYFKDYRFIFDNAENGSIMDTEKFFGKAVARRLEPPQGTRAKPINSEFTEDFYYNIDDAFKDGRKFIYILDSMDALDTKADLKKFNAKKLFRVHD